MPLIAAVAGAFAAWKGIKAVSDIAKTIGDAGKKIKTFGSLVSKGSGLLDGLAYAASSGTGVFASMAESFTLAGGGLSGLSAALGVIGGPITLVVVAIGALAAAFIYLWNTSDSFREFWINLWNNIKETTGQIVDGIVNFFTVTVPEGFNNFINTVSEIPGKITTFLTEVVSNVASWASEMVQKAIQAGSEFVSSAINFIQQLPSKVWSWLSNTISNAANFASQFVQQAIQAGQNFFSEIVNKIGQIPGEMISIGSEIVNGIKSGISGAWSSLTGWLGNMAKSLIDGVKSALGIGSPSRLFADRIGKWIPAGITLGVEQAMPKAKAFMGRMSNELIDAANMDSLTSRLALEGNPGGLGSGLGSTVVYQVDQTINSAKELRPSEIAQETERMVRRLAWA
jgi:phage-related protein